MADEVLNMSDLTLNKHRCKLKDLCFKTATKPYTNRCMQGKETRANIEDWIKTGRIFTQGNIDL